MNLEFRFYYTVPPCLFTCGAELAKVDVHVGLESIEAAEEYAKKYGSMLTQIEGRDEKGRLRYARDVKRDITLWSDELNARDNIVDAWADATLYGSGFWFQPFTALENTREDLADEERANDRAHEMITEEQRKRIEAEATAVRYADERNRWRERAVKAEAARNDLTKNCEKRIEATVDALVKHRLGEPQVTQPNPLPWAVVERRMFSTFDKSGAVIARFEQREEADRYCIKRTPTTCFRVEHRP